MCRKSQEEEPSWQILSMSSFTQAYTSNLRIGKVRTSEYHESLNQDGSGSIIIFRALYRALTISGAYNGPGSSLSAWSNYVCPPDTNRNSKKKKNSMGWVREWTIPTEQLPLVSEVIANFCGQRVPRGQCDGSLRPYSRFCRQELLLFYEVAPQLYSRGWVDPVPDPLLFLLL
jgi:hypothetical protein